MTVRTEWEARAADLLCDLAAAATTVSLYGIRHPRAVDTMTRLQGLLARMLADQPQLSIALLGEELFVQDRPFTRTSRHAAAVVRRLRRCRLDQVTFLAGLEAAELSRFLVLLTGEEELAEIGPHVKVGRLELPDDHNGEGDGSRLPRVRDRVALVQGALEAAAAGQVLPVGDLETVVRSLLDQLASNRDPLPLLAPWEGPGRWLAVHSHNVAAVSLGLTTLAGIPRAASVDVGIAALVHDLGRVFLPREVLARDLELSGSDLELVLDHPREALGLLLASPQAPPLALIVAYEHHLGFNGSGYPRLQRPRRPHPASRLVSVADVFDVLFTARGSRGLMTRESTLAFIAEEAGARLDPGWARALSQLLT